ncbi:MAG: peptidase M28, partial [Pseudomonadota bacterium]
YVVGGCGGDIAWHTEFDTMEVADRKVLATDVALYTEAVRHFATADVVPLDWRATAREFRATVERYAQAAGTHFDLAPSLAAVADLEAACVSFYAAVDEGAIAADKANSALVAVARSLIPINFVRGPRFTHDPALNTPALPTIEPALRLADHGPETIGFAKAQLMRGQNRLVAALQDAVDALNSARG